MSMEIVLRNSEVTIPQAIENIQYLRTELKNQLEYYEGIVVTPDTIKNAKSDKATLNKLKTAIDDQRKDVKKQVLSLYEPFEAECKELLSMIDKPIEMIDKQLKVFEEQQKQKKLEELTKFFEKVSPPPFVKLEHILNPKWGNVTVKIDTLKQEIAAEVQRIVEDVSEIRRLYGDSPMYTPIMQRFEQTRDKGTALAYAAEIERKEKAEQERRARETAEMQTVQPDPIPVRKSFATPENTVMHTTEQPEPIGQATFRVTGTRSQIRTLAAYMKENGIEYEVLK